ncbi:MAG: sulfotransferase [Leptospirales bacterium]
MKDSRFFFILGIQRSGTTMLMDLLGSHPDVLTIGEILKHNGKIKYPEFSFKMFLEESILKHKIRDIHENNSENLNEKNLDSYFNELRFRIDKKLIGIKLMVSQLNHTPDLWRIIFKHCNTGILVKRKNIIQILVSRMTAKKREAYTHAKKPEVVTVTIDPAIIVKQLDQIKLEQEQSEKIFSQFEGSKQTFVYETFKNIPSDFQRQLHKLLDLSKYNLTTDLVKSNPEFLNEIVENYKELKLALRDHHHFLSEEIK